MRRALYSPLNLFHQLEARIVPATTAVFRFGTLEVTGTENDDQITVTADANGNLQVKDNDQLVPIQEVGGKATNANLKHLVLKGLGGNDVLGVLYSVVTPPTAEIFAGNGDDDVFVGYDSSQPILSALVTNYVIHGGAGGDRVTVFQQIDVEESGGSFLIFGDEGDDFIQLGLSLTPSTMFGGDGDDVLDASRGDAFLYGGAGNDSLFGGVLGKSILHGGEGDDFVAGRAGDSLLFGDSGNDEIWGGTLSPFITPDAIATIFGGDGDDLIYGSYGRDIIFGGSGNDTISASPFFFTVPDEHTAFIDGGAGDDVIIGSSVNDVILGGSGNDTISGGGGDDVILGGSGNDSISGEEGNDQLDGGSGIDTLDGGEGDDRLFGGLDLVADTLTGGNGKDSFVITSLDVLTDFDSTFDTIVPLIRV